MLRPLLAFFTLCLAAFLLAPTVAGVHEKVTDLHIMRETPWEIFRWYDPPEPRLPLPQCGGAPKQLYSEVTDWPERIHKDEPFAVRGIVQNADEGHIGVGSIEVAVYLNETKTQPGLALGTAETDASGAFFLQTSLPFEIQASRYSLVAHAKEKRMGCNRYLEHWSDPETEIISQTRIEWSIPSDVVAGRNITLGGRLLDVVGAPVKNASVNLTIDGKVTRLNTSEEGVFEVPLTPAKPGVLKLNATFRGSTYYLASSNNETVNVLEELFRLDGGTDLNLTRSTATPVGGYLYVAESARKDSFTLRFQGMSVVPCEGCPATESVTVPISADGRFDLTLTVPPTEDPVRTTFTASGGGLKKGYPGNATLVVQPVLALDAKHTSFFGKGYGGSVNLTDEAGRPLSFPVVVHTPEGPVTNTTDAQGLLAFSGTAPACGPTDIVARYDGADGYLPVSATAQPRICGYLAFIPAWLLATPWWVWPVALALVLGAWQAYRAWRQRYAPVIMGGPKLTLAFTEPRDDASGYAAIGEAVVLTAFLEEPLPDGHRLRMGSPRKMEETPIDAELRAHFHLVPDKLGDVPLRAEVLDAKGRVVSRRSVKLHVVRYAEEIEKRYLALRASHGADEAVTPREFERWLHERAPGLDRDVARRLIHVFEEADYSPRTAGRAEFAAYMMAEKGVQEVAPLAS